MKFGEGLGGGGGSIPHSLASPPHSVIQVAFDPVTFAWLTLARHIHHVWEQKSFCDFPVGHKREKCEHKCTRKIKKKEKKKKPRWKAQLASEHLSEVRSRYQSGSFLLLCVPISVSLSFLCHCSFSAPLSLCLALSLWNFSGQKEMQICSDASRTKN